jgi:hypothetical protein
MIINFYYNKPIFLNFDISATVSSVLFASLYVYIEVLLICAAEHESCWWILSSRQRHPILWIQNPPCGLYTFRVLYQRFDNWLNITEPVLLLYLRTHQVMASNANFFQQLLLGTSIAMPFRAPLMSNSLSSFA